MNIRRDVSNPMSSPPTESSRHPAVEHALAAARRAGLRALCLRLERLATLLDVRARSSPTARRDDEPPEARLLLSEVERLHARLAALGVRCDLTQVPAVLPRPESAALAARNTRQTLDRLAARSDVSAPHRRSPSPADGGSVLP